MSVIYDRVALIGLGLIASSMFWAIKRDGLAREVTGYARSQATRDTARRIGLCDRVCDSAAEAVHDADLVVLAVPVGAMGAVAAEIGPHLKPGATVTDVGSVKARGDRYCCAASCRRACISSPGTRWPGPNIPAPRAALQSCSTIAGACWSRSNGTDPEAVDRLRRLWEAMGSNVDTMDADHHDLVLAVTSHAPHLIAYTMVGVADDLRRVTDSEVIKYSAAGFRDFTRIAASDPTMWRDVFLSNKDATLEILGRFTEELFALQRAIRTGDGDHLHEYFTRTRAIRRGIIEAGQDTDAPDFGRKKVSK